MTLHENNMRNESDDGFAIHVAVVDDAITVTMPGTRFPSLTVRALTRGWWHRTVTTTPTFHPANSHSERGLGPPLMNKARELGWIV